MKSNLFYAARVIALLAILAGALSLTGCANLKFQWSASYQTDNLKADIEAARKAEAK